MAIPDQILRLGIEKTLSLHHNFSVVSTYPCISKIPFVYRPDLTIFSTENDNDFNLIKQLIEKHNSMKTILFSNRKRFSANYIFSKNNNISALIFDQIGTDELLDIVSKAMVSSNSKTLYYPEHISSIMLNYNQISPIIFSTKDLEILHFMNQGKTINEIAHILSLKEEDIQMNCLRLKSRLSVKDMISVILYACSMKYIPLKEERELELLKSMKKS